MNAPLPEVPPPPPYSDAQFDMTDTGFRISFKLRDPYGLRGVIALVGIVAGLPGLTLFMWSFQGMLTFGQYSTWPALLIGGLLLGIAIACLILSMVAALMHALIICDGQSLYFGMRRGRGLLTGYRFPIADIEGLRVHRTARKALDLHFNAPRGERLAQRVPCHLEVVSAEGVVRVLSEWAEKDIRWAAQVVHVALGLSPMPDRDDALSAHAPPVMESGYTLPTRYRWLIGVPCLMVVGFVAYWIFYDGLQLEWETTGQVCVLLLFLLPLVWALHGGGGASNRALIRKYHYEGEVPRG